MECRRTTGQMVIPIFYDVDPSDVRHQTGSFEVAFGKHEERFELEMDKVDRWRAALTEAANLSGWDLRNVADGHEGNLIKKIVEEVSKERNSSTYLFVAEYPVGIESRVQEINSLLNFRTDDVLMVGIHGMGGIGKTTIAKAIYNQLFHVFECKSILANIREVAKQDNGLVRLQEQLLSDTLRISKIKVSSVDRGINMIKERLCNKKVLLILDDIDHFEQLCAIARNRDWFGRGSRIIITTRDEHLLRKIEVNEIYKARKMNDIESLVLFSWHAFHRRDPDEDYAELSRDVITYCGGLPLALEVLGSFLFGRSMVEWKSASEKLRRIPHDQIQKKLRLSFDDLSDDNEKDIFLDIACFFLGMDKHYVIQILNGCGYFAEIGLGILMQRCFVTISGSNKLIMHDLLRDMGRQIVREKSPKEPGKYSRLWLDEDIIKMLERNTGTEAIKGLALTLPKVNNIKVNANAFDKLQNLRLLQLDYVQVSGGYEHLSKELRWIRCHGFPLKFIPNSFYKGNIVAIDMRHSNLRQAWKDSKIILEKLKFLNLSHSYHLTKTPDFSNLPNLEELKLKDCKSLVEIHHSIGCLQRLILVDLKDCTKLKSVPRGFCKLRSLRTLILSGCSKFENLPKDLGDLESLTTLIANGTAIKEVPFTIERLKNLTKFLLSGDEGSPSKSLPPSRLWPMISARRSADVITQLPPSVQGLTCLTILHLMNCNLSDDALPKDLWSLSSLEEINLAGNNFHSLPIGLSNLSKLLLLDLGDCRRLQTIPDLPTSLSYFDVNNCTSLVRLPSLSNCPSLSNLNLINCNKLLESQKSDILRKRATLLMERLEQIIYPAEEGDILLEQIKVFGGITLLGNKIPKKFLEKKGSSMHLDVPQFNGDSLVGLSVCFVYSCHFHRISLGECNIVVINHSRGVGSRIFMRVLMFQGDHIWKGTLTRDSFDMGSGDEVEIVIYFYDDAIVKKTGVFLHFDGDENSDDLDLDTDDDEKESEDEEDDPMLFWLT